MLGALFLFKTLFVCSEYVHDISINIYIPVKLQNHFKRQKLHPLGYANQAYLINQVKV